MLEPRETDIPALFLFLVVLPLVAYFLLGRWSEVSKKKERASLLAQCAAEEAFRAESMTAASLIPLSPLTKIGVHECARCYAPSTTRCSRCKSVRYCSGKCQIIHWRQVHKHECQQLEYNSSSSSPKSVLNEKSIHERVLFDNNMDSQCLEYNTRQGRHENTHDDDVIQPPPPVNSTFSEAAACTEMDTSELHLMERRSADKRVSRKSNREMLRREDGAILESSDDACRRRAISSTSSTNNLSKEAGNKFKESNSLRSEEEIHGMNKDSIPDSLSNRRTTSRSRLHVTQKLQSQNENIFESRNDFGISNSAYRAKNAANVCNIETELKNGVISVRAESTSSDEKVPLDCSSEGTSTKRSNKAKSASRLPGTKMHRSSKSTVKASMEQSCSDMERKEEFADDSNVGRLRDTVPARGGNGVSSMGFMKMIGLMRSSKPDRPERAEVTSNRHKTIKMLFPYEEFVKFFQSDFFNLSPRGFVNCGNSCYANAVLQCLTCTKPLTIFLLRRSHSRACCAKDWCLMCELEQHVTMLTESGGPLSPSRILSHMRSINCQIGDGSQEDAHEFLRFLITSMQSICLEGLGGENVVDARLQETTFIQHTFGGRLRSKVKCLRCHHESERCESIMDLTLEIFGWVESLEDALTQFTSAEDLDGENMYRCGRCAAYVRARKQLCIQEAPNILTIVLKRFQEGSYGKINKCITFPEMLDMVPFMTGTDDIPPLYILYAVVVHLDTLNASFSGHYVAYVKDLQGSWFRIDDTQVQPVQMSQVMSEGAYILFYMRSCPRPARAYTEKPIRHQAPGFPKHWSSKTQKSSRSGQNKSGGHLINSEHSIDHKPEMPMGFTNHPSNGIFSSSNSNRPPFVESYAKSTNMEFSDATSSDWSIFTSSDDASFTTESTRDSFSTVDYADAGNTDPISSIFYSFYTPDYSSSHKTVSCSRFYSNKPRIGFVSEENGCVWDSLLSTQHVDRLQKGENRKQVSVLSIEALPSVYFEDEDDNPIDAPSRNLWSL